MDKNSIKKFATWARRELIERVSQRAMIYGITAENFGDPSADSVNSRLLSYTEKRQRRALIKNISAKGYANVVEEVAYTWFNRFAALRFMEVNGFLPSRVRIFTNDAGEFKPQILSEAINLELDGLDKKKVFELVDANKTEELFKYLLIVECNALNKILPGMFQRIDDYTELLLPDYLLREGSVIEQLVIQISEADWTDQVQIIGWLYQYYNAELKDKVFADLKRNVKISKENIPAATQLFTPDWIVRYMVENSLGRLWLEGHPDDELQAEWKFFLPDAAQDHSVQIQLATLRDNFAALNPEDIRVIDPCMGSGHILCVLFDVLVRIYESFGYTRREAAVNIVEKNLWGLDIDERAAQLAYFAVMMKARQYDRRFFSRNVMPHVFAIHASNDLREDYLNAKNYFRLSAGGQDTLDYLIDLFADAKDYGSIIQPAPRDYRSLQIELLAANEKADGLFYEQLLPAITHLVEQASALAQNYHVVVTNPPYMGSSGMGAKLAAYVKKNFPDSKSDLFAVFIERCAALTAKNFFQAVVTMQSWMFLSSFEKLRERIVNEKQIVSLMHMENMVMHIAFGTAATIFQNAHIVGYKGTYNQIKLCDIIDDGEEQPKNFPVEGNRFAQVSVENFSKIPGAPIAYWVSKTYLDAFNNGKLLGTIADSKQGIATADNNRFLRLWYECDYTREFFDCTSHEEAATSNAKWFPYNKGGEFRKWYGNNDYVVNWLHDGEELRFFSKAVIRNPGFYFRECASWNKITSGATAFRYKPRGHIFDVAGLSLFTKQREDLFFLLALCNSVYVRKLLEIISPTLNCEVGHVSSIPVIIKNRKEKIIQLAAENISLSRADWDAFETSWDFKEHPFITAVRAGATTINRAYDIWQAEAAARFDKLKSNEEELNKIFIEIYGLVDELTAAVDEKDVSVRRAELAREVRSFLSYAVGCMFGRYTLDTPGLVYAGGEWSAEKYTRFQPNKHEIIPISDAEYFEEDVVRRLAEFLTAAFGEQTLEENLQQIAEALGKSGSPREAIRNYFINEFYSDHVKIYRKRPIYWLFDSGKRNGFKCLVYLHRYRRDSIARIRTDYVHEQQSRYRMAEENLEKLINGASSGERAKLTKRLEALRGQSEEIRLYEEKIHHLADKMEAIDLDEGVKKNYDKFAEVLAKIK